MKHNDIYPTSSANEVSSLSNDILSIIILGNNKDNSSLL